MKLDRDFYLRPGLTVAPELIGKQLVHRTADGVTKGIIVEAEAYIGPDDAASHAYKNLHTKRTAIQYGEGGFAYIYIIYGLHICMNIVTNIKTYPEVVLLRALQPTSGIDLMKTRRNMNSVKNLCNGPGKLSKAMGIGKNEYGINLCGDELYLETVDNFEPTVISTRRINIDYAGEAANYLWRFIDKDNSFISVKQK